MSRPKASPARVRPTTKRTLRALNGTRVVVEGFGKRAPTFFAIVGGDEAPRSVWLAPAELRRMIQAGRKILK